jgi:tRNA(fMet)-specific endonuclease VapC
VKYLLDTDSLSYFFRGEGRIAEHLRALMPSDIGIPAPVLYESRHGMLRLSSGQRQTALLRALDQATDTMEVVPFDGPAAEAAARIRTHLEKLGTTIGPIDIQIAGLAVARAAILVTRNVREFSRVEGLGIDDWYEAGPPPANLPA